MNKVCPQYSPFGKIQYNVFHDSGRFGLYVDHQHPRNLIRDDHGYVVDNRKSCGYFTDDGLDNGVTSIIEDHFDYHNTFTGGYAFGDISFKRLFSVNQAHNMYWKQSKNFADKKSYHLEDSVFLNNPQDSGLLRLLLPGGNFVFKMKNVTFAGQGQAGGEGVIMAPQVTLLSKQFNSSEVTLTNVL